VRIPRSSDLAGISFLLVAVGAWLRYQATGAGAWLVAFLVASFLGVRFGSWLERREANRGTDHR
jgi:steroid 5-alpha reductase family enzyme